MKKRFISILLLSAFILTGCSANNAITNTDNSTAMNNTEDMAVINSSETVNEGESVSTEDELIEDELTEEELTEEELTEEELTEEVLTYETISPTTAKEMIDENEDLIILDVRTLDEYNDGHIENAVLLPNTNILEKAEDVIKDKDTVILVYCRSGNRSATASADLVSLGYTNVYDFGGIIDWIYGTVTE